MIQSDIYTFIKESDLINFWKKCTEVLKDNIASVSYNTWIKPITPISFKNNVLTLQVPANIFKDWIFQHYKLLIEKTASNYLGKSGKVEILVASEQLIFQHEEHNSPIPDLIRVSKDLLENLIKNLKIKPELLENVTPREFELLVAELLRKLGYDVQITPKIKDGGKDIFAHFKTPSDENVLYLVECKKYRADRPVGIDIVRALYGTLQSERANIGMLVTTSNFTKGAKQFEQLHKSQISLKDYNVLKDWIQNK